MKIAENFAVKLFAYREREREKKKSRTKFSHRNWGAHRARVYMSEHVVGNLIQFEIYDRKKRRLNNRQTPNTEKKDGKIANR